MSWKSSRSLRLSNIIKLFVVYRFCESSVDFAISTSAHACVTAQANSVFNRVSKGFIVF